MHCGYAVHLHLHVFYYVATHWMKYYHSLFLGLLDMGIVNAFVVTKMHLESQNEAAPTHADFLMTLQSELLALRDADLKHTAPRTKKAMSLLYSSQRSAAPRIRCAKRVTA